MIKKIIKINVFLFMVLSLSGCFSYKEINELAIVSAVSIDINDQDKDKYDVGVQIMNAKKKENSNVSEITFYMETGKTIFQALQKILLDSPKELYLGHNEVVVIGEELLKEKDPTQYLDYFMRDTKTEKDSVVIIASESKAYDVLKVLTPLETVPSRNLKATLLASSKVSGVTIVSTLDEFISSLSSKGEEAILPSVKIQGDIKEGENIENISESDPDTKLMFSDLGVLKDNKLIGYLNENESFGYNIIDNVAKDTYINFKCDDKNYGSLKVSTSKTEEKLSFKDGKPFVKLSNIITADLTEYNCKSDIFNNKTTKEIEKKVSNKVAKAMKNATDKIYKDFKTDALNYGSKFYKEKNKEMKKLNIKVEEIKNNISFEIKSDVKIKSTELTINSIKKEKKYE